MEEANRLARLGAVVELIGCLLNGMLSLTWMTLLALFLVGFLWIVPLGLVALEVCFAGLVLVIGHTRIAWVSPALGLFVCLCNLNVMGAFVFVAALRLQLRANAAAAAEQEEDLRLAA
jgi:hypothetical protein